MIGQSNFSAMFAKALLAATPENQLMAELAARGINNTIAWHNGPRVSDRRKLSVSGADRLVQFVEKQHAPSRGFAENQSPRCGSMADAGLAEITVAHCVCRKVFEIADRRAV
ncbi:hypothetical protein GCM10007874_22500 [Labrys miyagiensis]|uniref:Uncharacterized protein n=1 Tax=Labrys miyagiensis TaxID=346912 RepID=A0ABQ6CFU6_9HYPH|nr:hypothetical protein GCM10007874_22500 [Labrys miyagiensis]